MPISRFIMIALLLNLLLIVLTNAIKSTGEVEGWDFLVLSDFHGAEYFASTPGTSSNAYKNHLEVLSYIKSTYGGDLFMLPGDMENGEWHEQEWINKYYPNHNPQQAVSYAGFNCYTTVRTLFSEAGYNKILVAVGDHELGDNRWQRGNNKTMSLPQFRQSLVESLYTDQVTGNFLYDDKIGTAEPTPYNTVFERTSFAHQHKNVLFITVDSYVQVDNTTSFFDREGGVGGEGVVTGDVRDAHLVWFKSVLVEAQKIASIKHIIVQSHLPVLSPVQKVSSSAMSFDYAENSKFWKLMVKHKVDLYLAGEVHAYTTMKDTKSNLVQIISRGNGFGGFLNVHVTEEGLQVLAYNEVGPKPKRNMKYVIHGSLTVNKDVELDESTIESSGVLKLLDISEPLIHFSFEEILHLKNRQIFGLTSKERLIGTTVTIRNIDCKHSMPNHGVFGQQYDAQVANVQQVTDGGISGHAGAFDDMTRMSIYSFGPQVGGQVVSFAIWFKTRTYNSEMILVSYDRAWGNDMNKNSFTLTLNNGTPMVYANAESFLKPNDNYQLNDGQWHHIAVSMIHHICLLSEVNIFIDGINVLTTVKNDLNIFVIGYGHISIGGLGYSSSPESDSLDRQSFTGMVDDFYLWGRTIKDGDLFRLLNRYAQVYASKSCMGAANTDYSIRYHKKIDKCRNRCLKQLQCLGYEKKLGINNRYRCTLFKNVRPNVGETTVNGECGLVKFWGVTVE